MTALAIDRWVRRLLLLALLTGCQRSTTYTGVGDVTAIDEARRHVTISHEDIPGLMPAMTMTFAVRSPEVLTGVAPGARVRFDLVPEGHDLIVTRAVPVGAAGGARPGLHDHTPHHGGVVAMAGMLHVEAAAGPDGRVRVYLTDLWRRPLPLDGVTGTVTLDLPDRARTLSLGHGDDALEASGPPLTAAEVLAHVRLTRAGEPIELNFLLPMRAGAPGAALVPATGCTPPAARPGAGPRLPRCALPFPRPTTVVAATPDGTTALVALVGGGVTAWRMPGGELLTGFAPPPPVFIPVAEPPHIEAANAIAVSPDGREAVVALENRLLRYAIATGQLVRALPGPGGIVRAVAWSPDGSRLLVTAFYNPIAHLIAADDGRELRRLPLDAEGAAVAFAPDGRLAVAGTEPGPIALFDLDGGGPPRWLSESKRAVEALAFAGDRLLSASADRLLRVWDVGSGARVVQHPLGGPSLRLAVAPGGGLVASAGAGGTVQLHDLARGGDVETLAWHRAPVLGLAWAGSVLVTGDAEGEVALWDLADRVTAR